ncbi:hypothetical protein ABW19_dt0200083 [Dactylella cylindrospora]|nr:hypothetical protein ABW19_dt0200083 [Dactylella cylindrospora]
MNPEGAKRFFGGGKNVTYNHGHIEELNEDEYDDDAVNTQPVWPPIGVITNGDSHHSAGGQNNGSALLPQSTGSFVPPEATNDEQHWSQ